MNHFKKYFLQRVKIENYNIEIDRTNCYDQLVNYLIKQYDEVKNVSTERQSDDYTMVVHQIMHILKTITDQLLLI